MIANPFLSRDKHFVSGTWSQSCTEVQRLWQTPEEAAEAAGLGCPQAQSPWTPTASLIRSLWSVAGDYDHRWTAVQGSSKALEKQSHQVPPQAADLVLLNQGTFLCSWTTQTLRCAQCLASWGCYEEEDLIRLDKGHGSFCCCSNVLFPSSPLLPGQPASLLEQGVKFFLIFTSRLSLSFKDNKQVQEEGTEIC